jgi:magnesium chelatase family protein
MRARVENARALQQRRGFYNARIPSRLLRQLCALDEAGERTLEMAVRRMGLSARAHDRILKVARTIADLDSAESAAYKQLAEAMRNRGLDLLVERSSLLTVFLDLSAELSQVDVSCIADSDTVPSCCIGAR